MAGTLSEIRSGMATSLSSIRGLRVSTQLPEQINPPVAIIGRSEVVYHRAMRGGTTEWSMEVQLIAGRMADQAAQRQIDAWLSWDGPQSVRAALEDDPTLGGVVDTCTVLSADALTSFQIGDSDYLGVTFQVQVNG